MEADINQSLFPQGICQFHLNDWQRGLYTNISEFVKENKAYDHISPQTATHLQICIP